MIRSHNAFRIYHGRQDLVDAVGLTREPQLDYVGYHFKNKIKIYFLSLSFQQMKTFERTWFVPIMHFVSIMAPKIW